MKKVKFNINYYVWVKLTPEGEQVYINYWNRHEEMLMRDRPYTSIKDTFLKIDKDGYACFQLWNLLEIFGKYIHTGFSNLFDTEIYFDKEDFKEE